MSKKTNPEYQDTAGYMPDILNLSPDVKTEAVIDHILIETSQLCIDHIARELRNTYCETKRLQLLPSELADNLRTNAAAIFVKLNQTLNTRLKKLYELQGGSYEA